MKRFSLFLLAGIVLLFGECRNDIDLLDEYRPVLVCYGLLNPFDTVQYVRVSKGFLGEGNALVMAQNRDTIGFGPGMLDVRIEQWNNNQLQNVYLLSPDTSIPRDSGVFLYPYQVLYRGIFPVLKDGSSYRLIVTDLVKNQTVRAETYIPQDVSVLEPVSVNAPLNLEDSTSIRFRFKNGRYGLRYDFFVRFHYSEQFIYDTTQVSEHYVDWHMGEVTAQSNAGGENLQYAVSRRSFLNMLAARIPYNSQVRRICGKIDLVFTGATDDLVTYIEVGQANQTTAASIPPYSNIHDGYGLFAARTTNLLPGYVTDQDTRYAIRTDNVTQQLNFIR